MFWIRLVSCFLIPAMMVAFGSLWRAHPPKTINGVYGYRTRRSTQNQETWAFAHGYVGRLWRRWGWVLAAATAVWGGIARLLPAVDPWLEGVLLLQLAVLLATIPCTERALGRTFCRDGSRRKEHEQQQKSEAKASLFQLFLLSIKFSTACRSSSSVWKGMPLCRIDS